MATGVASGAILPVALVLGRPPDCAPMPHRDGSRDSTAYRPAPTPPHGLEQADAADYDELTALVTAGLAAFGTRRHVQPIRTRAAGGIGVPLLTSAPQAPGEILACA